MIQEKSGIIFFIDSLFSEPSFLMLFLIFFIVIMNLFLHDSLSAIVLSDKKIINKFKNYRKKYKTELKNGNIKKAKKIKRKMMSIKTVRKKCVMFRLENVYWSIQNALVFSFIIITPFYLYITK